MRSVRMFLASLVGSAAKPGVSGVWLAAFLLLNPSARAQEIFGGAFQFTSARFIATETEGVALVTVTRNTDIGKMMIDVVANNGTATNGTDFRIHTSGTNLITLTFNDLQSAVTFPVTINNNSASNAGGQMMGRLVLTNARPSPDENPFFTGRVATARAAADLVIFDDDAEMQFNFDRLLYTVSEPNPPNGNTVNLIVKLAREPGEEAQGVEVDYEVTTRTQLGTRAGSDFATPGADYEPMTGTLTFGATETQQTITVAITNDTALEFNEDFHVVLTEARGTVTVETPPTEPDGMPTTEERRFTLGRATSATVTIRFNPSDTQELPAGAVDQSYNVDNDPDTFPPSNPLPGANNTVYGIASGPGGTTYVVGNFTAVNAVSRNRIARLDAAGQLDFSFNPPSGANDFVTAVAVYTNGVRSGQVLVGGGFTAVNGVQRNGIARLLSNGSTDLSFDPGTGANGPVYAISLQKDGGILVGGDFTLFNGIPRNRLVRLQPDGTVDLGFSPGTGANAPIFAVQSISVDPIVVEDQMVNGSVGIYSRTINVGAQSGFLSLTYNFQNETNDLRVLAGSTNFYSGRHFNEVISSNAAGNPVTNFVPRTVTFPFVSANSNITIVINTGGTNEATNWNFSATIQADRSLGLFVGGDFDLFNGVEHGRVAKLNNNGSLDTNFNRGTGIGADGTVFSLATQGSSLIIGGAFGSFNSFPAGGIARLHADGSFDRTFQTGSGADDGVVNAITTDAAGRILIAGSFTSFNQTRRVFLARLQPNGPLDTSFMDPSYNQYAGFPNPSGLAPSGFLTTVALAPGDNVLVGGLFSRVGGGNTRTDIRPRNNFARLIGGSNTNRPGNIQFTQTLFGGDENAGTLSLSLARADGRLGSGGVVVSTRDGSAVSTNDYVGVTNRVVLWAVAGPNQADGETGDKVIPIALNDDTLIEGNEQFFASIFSPVSTFTLGGEFIPAGFALGEVFETVGTILDNDVPASIIEFSQAEYDVNEHDRVTITVNRTGGVGSAVSVRYTTVALSGSGAATAGQDFVPTTGVLSFLSGQTNKTFTITLVDDEVVEQDERVLLTLSSLSPGAIFGANSNAFLNIIDNDYAPGRVNFSATNYTVGEGAGFVSVTVRRTGGNAGILRVDFQTTDLAAVAPLDYSAVSGTLVWNDRDSSPRTIEIPIHEDGLVEGTENFAIRLVSAQPADALGVRTNATILIQDNDALGSFSFNAGEYLADENGTNVIINVVRRGGSADTVSVEFFTTNVTAQAGRDYVSTNGTLTFGVGETSKSFSIALIDNLTPNSDRQLRVVLRNPQPAGASLGLLTNVLLTIIDNESFNIPAGSVETDFGTGPGADNTIQALELMPDGRILIGGDFTIVNRQVRTHLARLRADGTLDTTFGTDYNIDGSVRAIELLADGRIIIGGTFTNINGLPARHIARISSSGALDNTFNTGAGADNPIFAVAQTQVGGANKVLIGGSFSTYNGVARRGIARVNDDGRADTAFNPGSGVNGTVYALKVQRDGKILIGGEFTSVAGVPRINIARLNQDGSLDLTFDGALEAGGSVRSIEVQFDDRILIGGTFTSVSGLSRRYLARLNQDGSIDTTFNPGSGANAAVYAVALQLDGKIVVGGDFTSFNGVPQNRIVRLNPDGSIDPSINFGRGANGFIAALAIQPDRRIVAAGGFTEFDGQPRGRYARIYGGSISGSGALEFAQSNFAAHETGTNVVITVRRTGGLLGAVTVNYTTRERTATAGVDYVDVSGTLSFVSGENTRSFTVPLLDDNLAEPAELVDLLLSSPTGGAVLGRQPQATLTILSDDTVISFSELNYTVNETAPGGRAIISIVREGDATFPVSVQFTASAGTANSADFTPVNTRVTIEAGQSTAVVAVPIIDDLLVEENETVLLRLSAPGPGGLLGRANATLTILDNDFAPGVLSVIAPEPVPEDAGSVTITVLRSSGRTGAVSVRYALRNGTATAGEDFVAGSGVLAFLEGETTNSFVVQILDDNRIEGNESFQVELFEATGGATVGARFTPVLILDDDFGPGSLDTSFAIGTGANGTVRDIDVQADGKILLGGEFTSFDGSFAGGVARLLQTGDLDSAFSSGSGAAGPVFSLAPHADGTIGVGGDFTSLGNVIRRYVARLQTNGFADPTFAAQAGENARVLAVEAQSNGKLVVGGEFTTPARRILRLNTDGTLDVSFSPDGGTDGPVHAIAIQPDDRILIGGSFNRVGVTSVRGIARLLPNGLLDSSFAIGAGVNGVVNAIVVQPDGKILIAGDFTTVNGVGRARIARLNADGSLDTTFNLATGPNSAINALAYVRGKIYLGGNFTSVGGATRNRIARLNLDGTLDTEFDAGIGPNATVFAIEGQRNGQVLLGGAFTTVNGFPSRGIARLNGDAVSAEPRIENTRVAGNNLQFSFASEIGTSYVIEGSTDLYTWTPVETRVATSATTEFSAPIAGPHRFYRVRINP